jgi:hypothetical protein
MKGSIHVKLRPLKFCFLVNPGDPAALLEAIKINSLLWGGTYNPIIPIHKKIPNFWKKDNPYIPNGKSANDITKGYFDNFDPDYYVPIGNVNISALRLPGERILPISRLLPNNETQNLLGYGVHVFDIINHFMDTELKYVRRDPLNIFLPRFNTNSELFLASFFGKLPDKYEKLFLEHYKLPLNLKTPTISLENYIGLLPLENYFIRRFCSSFIGLKNAGYSYAFNQGILLYFDATNFNDVVDYWNLRATGRKVIPIAKQGANSTQVLDFIANYLIETENSRKSGHDISQMSYIIKGRSISHTEFDAYIEELKLAPPKPGHRYPVRKGYMFPRIWDETTRNYDGVECCGLMAEEKSYDIISKEKYLDFKTVDPAFVNRAGGGNIRYANAVTLDFFGSIEPLAEIIPEGNGPHLVRSIGALNLQDWRFSRKELVYYVSSTRSKFTLSIPVAKDVFMGWLKSQGWKIEISPAGKIAYQINTQLEGVDSCSIISHKSVLDLLEKMEEGKVVPKKVMFQSLSEMSKQKRYLIERNTTIEILVDSGMIQLGFEVQCTLCQQNNWYSLKDIDYHLNCPKCGGDFKVLASSISEKSWAYKAFGPFTTPKRASGAYCVLLTYRFFAHLMHASSSTPIFSFTGSKEKVNIEVDFAMFFKQSKFSENYSARLLFAECKTFNDLTYGDIKRVKTLCKEFPTAEIVFATLKEKLSETEKKLILPLAIKSRKLRSKGLPYTPIMILTAAELMSDNEPPWGWQELGPFHQKYYEKYHNNYGRFGLSDITQEMYLGLQSWEDWDEQQRAKLYQDDGSKKE